MQDESRRLYLAPPLERCPAEDARCEEKERLVKEEGETLQGVAGRALMTARRHPSQ